MYSSQPFSLSAKGTLPQVVKLLHGFYSADYMHRITKLSITPIKDSKDLRDALKDEKTMPTIPCEPEANDGV